MECNHLPNPEIWDQLEQEKLRTCRLHIQYCAACRERVLKAAPDQLLFDIQVEPLPEDFWFGFWNSLDQKRKMLKAHDSAGRDNRAPAISWAAVVVIGLLILSYGRPIREEGGTGAGSARIPRAQLQAREALSYPVIENLENPDAHYYIFQSGEQEKIVMVFDPNMEL